jgi:hypothetical protein
MACQIEALLAVKAAGFPLPVEKRGICVHPTRRLLLLVLLTQISAVFPLSDLGAVSRGAVRRGVDEENCLVCHKYPKMGLYTKEGRRIFYVGENTYAQSVHAKVPCRGCHTDIDQIPHRQDHKAVDCAISCHMKDPFSNKEFSHASIRDSLLASVHAPKENEPPEKTKHKPNCKYCHLNPLYRFEKDYETASTLKRCRDCHEARGVERAFEHMLYRMGRRTSRDAAEIVDLCSSCHADKSLMKVFDKSVAPAKGYKEYFHGKAVMRGWGQPANCADCHTAHAVYPHDDARSTVYKSSLLRTCGENPSCHPNANPNFVQAAVHVALEAEENRVLLWVSWGFRVLTVGTMSFLILHVFLDLNRQFWNLLGRRKGRRKTRAEESV